MLANVPLDFPTHVGDLFEFESINLGYYDDYIYAGITPIFIGPKSAVADELPASSGQTEITYDEYEIKNFGQWYEEIEKYAVQA